MIATMEGTHMVNLIIHIITIITWGLFVSANIIPIILIVANVIKSRKFETSDLALKLFFYLNILTIIGYTIIVILGNPNNWRLFVLLGFLGILVIITLLGIALIQLRIIRGKGAIKRFFKP